MPGILHIFLINVIMIYSAVIIDPIFLVMIKLRPRDLSYLLKIKILIEGQILFDLKSVGNKVIFVLDDTNFHLILDIDYL